MDKLNDKELNYILRDIPNKLNLSTIFKKRKLFAFGSGNTHLSSANLIIINKEDEDKIYFNNKINSDLVSKFKLNYIENKYIKSEVRLEVDRTALGLMGKEYFLSVNQFYSLNHNKNYFFVLDDNFTNRYSKSYEKNEKTVQNHSVSNLPSSLSSNLCNFLNYLISKNGKKISIEDEIELFELSNIGNPYGYLQTKYLNID